MGSAYVATRVVLDDVPALLALTRLVAGAAVRLPIAWIVEPPQTYGRRDAG